MSLPAAVIEIGLTTNPSEATVWEDVSAYCMGYAYRRGRQNELGQIQAASCTVVLRNDDRRFDPTWTGNTYYTYTDLVPRRRLRISLNDNGLLYRRFTGYIKGWKLDYTGTLLSTATLTASDGVDVLANVKLHATYPSQASGARINAVLDDASWTLGGAFVLDSPSNGQLDDDILGPVGDRLIDIGTSVMQASTLAGVSAWQHLLAVVEAENGALFFAADGTCVFHSRRRRIGNKRNQLTFSDVEDLVWPYSQWPYRDVTFDYGDDWLYNVVSVTREGGTVQTAQDAASKAIYLPRTLEKSGLLLAGANEYEAHDMAEWLLNQYKAPALRVASISLSGLGGPDGMWGNILSRELDDKITVKRNPPGAVEEISCRVRIEEISERYEPGKYSMTWRLSPLDLTDYLILDNAITGQLDEEALAY